jgi:hypothetical protein
MKKIFKIYNAVSTDVDLEDTIEVTDIQDVYDIIRSCWGVQSFQVKFKYNEYSNFYEIALTNKLGEIFAWIGDLNFNPYN